MDAQDRAIQKLAKELAGIKREVVSWRGPQLDYSSIENSGNITFKDGDGNVTAVVGGQDDGSNTIRHVDGPVPPIPSGLSAHVDGPIVQVSWGGTFETDVTHDWHYLEVLAVGPNNEQLTGTIDNADGGSTSLAATSQGDWVVVARSVSRAGKRSLDGDAGTVAVQLVGLTGAIEAVQSSADGKNTIYYSATMPPGTDYVDGDLWFDTSEDGNNRASVWDGAEWLSVADGRVTDIAAAQDVLDANQEALDGRLDDAFGQIEDAIVSANGKNVVHYEDAPPTESDPGVEGDTWFVGQVGRPEDIIEATNLALNPRFANGLAPQTPNNYDEILAGGGGIATIVDGWLKLEKGTGNYPTAYAIDTRYAEESRWQGKTFTVSATLRLDEPTQGSVSDHERRLDFGYVQNGNYNYGKGSPGQAPNVPGEYRLSVVCNVPVDASAWFVRFMGDVSTTSATPTYWTDVVIEEGASPSEFFDGDTPSGTTDNEPHYRWTGAPHASTSEKYLPALDIGESDNWNVTEQYQHDGTGWKRVELSHEVISTMDVGKLVAGSAAIKEAVVQKLWAEVVVAKMVVADEFIGENAILTGAVTADKMAVGSITAESGIIESLDLGTATVGELDGIRIAAQTIRGQQLSGDAIDGKVITGATYRTTGGSGSWSDDGLFIAQPDGTSTVRFPTDGSPLSLTASDVQIDRASITDLDLSYGSVRSGGEFTLASGVTAPASPPKLTTGWQKVASLQKPDVALSYDWLGLGYWASGAGYWVRAVNVLGAEGDTLDEIHVYSVDGVFERSIPTGLNPRHGVTVIGDVAYVLGPDYEQSNIGKQWVHGFDLNTGARVSRWEFTDFAGGTNKLGIGTHGANLLVAGNNLNVSRRVHLLTFNPATGEKIGDTITTNEWVAYTKDIQGVHRDGNKLWVSHVEAVREFTISGTTITYDPSGAWGNPNNNAGGVAFRGAIPYVVDVVGNVYKGSRFASDTVLEVCFVWTNGTYLTTPSPISTIDQGARQETTISLPVRAGLSKRVYTRTAGTANWAKYDIAENVTSARVSGGFQVETLPATNTFPNADPATFKSTNNKFVVKGDGSGHWGPLTFNADGTMSGLVVYGEQVGTVDAINTPKKTAVTFPSGRFTKPPVVWVIPSTGGPHEVFTSVLNEDITASGFQFSLARTENTYTTGVRWFAMDAE